MLREQAEDLAEEVLYWACKQVDGDALSGTSLGSAAVALGRWGQPEESFWPYDPARDEAAPSYTPPPNALLATNCRKARLSPVPLNVAEIRQHVAAGRTVVLAVPVSQGFLATTDGWILMPAPGEPFFDGHALLVVGYDDGGGVSNGYLIVRNSWTRVWGDDGYGYLPVAYVVQHGLEAWIIEPIR